MKILKSEEFVVLQKTNEEIEKTVSIIENIIVGLNASKEVADNYITSLENIKDFFLSLNGKEKVEEKKEMNKKKENYMSLKEIYDFKSSQSPYYKLRQDSREIINNLLTHFREEWIDVSSPFYRNIVKGYRFLSVVKVLEKRRFCSVIRDNNGIEMFKFNFKNKSYE